MASPGGGIPGRRRRRSSAGWIDTTALGDFLRRRGGWIAMALVALIAVFAGYVVWTLRDLPDPGHQDVLAGTVSVYDHKGRLIEQRNSNGQYHEVLRLHDMGKYGPDATLAAEDRNFYNHGALDLAATARAALVDLTNRGYAQGGSTITQQLIKIQLLTPQKSIFRKLQEAILAEAVEQRYSKDQILEMYLNRAYYGHNAYGLGAATKTYFGANKEPKDLTVAQAAFLAGLVNAPYYYDPQTHFDRARARQLYVLKGMVARHDITQEEADKAAQENIQAELKYDTSGRRSLAPHFVDYVLSRLEKQYGSAAIQHGGFNVYTTLDLDLQAQAEKAVREGVGQLRRGGVNNGMLLAVKPDTGEVLAWVGSADYYNNDIGGQYDVILSPRQPGSSFKPYDVQAALHDRKATLATVLQDKPTDFGGGYRPLDFDNRFLGDISVRRSLLLSRNVPMVQLAQKEGMSNVNGLAHAMGIKTELQNVPSTAIGGSEVTMYDHVQAYEVFANQGQKMPLMTLTKVTDGSGSTLFSQQPGKQDGATRVLTPAETYLVTDVLKDYQRQWQLGWRRQMASKSGTTGGSETGVHKDAWMMAYSPDIVVGAWGGNTAAGGGGTSISTFGTEVGDTILASFINGLPPSYKNWYQRPDGIVDGRGCPGQDNAGHELFLAGTENLSGCTSTPSPTPSATPTAAATPPPTPTPTPLPSIPPTPIVSPPVRTPTPPASTR